jgi:hypothetical protein
MVWDPRGLNLPQVALLGLIVTVGVVVLYAGVGTAASFTVFNTDWNGGSQLETEATEVNATTEVLVNTERYTTVSANDTVAFVLSPDRPYERAERRHLADFVRRGGTLVIAEDFGTNSNSLLETVGANARFDGRPLRDEQYNFRSPAMPVADNGTETAVTDTTTTLTLNHGTAIRPNGSTVGLTSSQLAYLDDNRNQELDEDERVDAYPVLTVESVGNGRVVAVSDPSVFLNVMLERPGNRAFTRGLLREKQVLFDLSHADAARPPLAYGLSLVRDSVHLQGTVVAGGVLALLLVARVARIPSLLRADATAESEESKTLASRYSRLAERRVRKLMTNIMLIGEKDNRDD